MNICLVNPPLFKNALYEEWDLSAVDSVSPPLGILLLAGILREKGHSVSVVDAYARVLSASDAAKEVLFQRPDVVGLTAMTPSIYGAAEVARLLKLDRPELKVVVGGAHLSAVPQETFKLFPHFDIGVIGEGDDTIVELLGAFPFDDEKLSSINGIIFRKNGGLTMTTPRQPLADMDALPLPAWDLLPSLNGRYRMSIVGTTSDRSTAIITSRGCPGACTFCDTTVFGKKFRGYSAEYVVRMIEHLMSKYGIEDLLIYDDNFVTGRERLKEVCRLFISRKLKISWSCCARVNMVNPEVLKLMKDAGCWQVEYGIESGSPKILEIMNKHISLEQVRQALRWTKEAGIMTRGNFIFGYLGETKETLKETLDFLLDAELDYFQQTFLTPYPGSEVYQTAAQYGKVDLDWQKMSNMSINFIPEGLSEKELVNFSKLAFRKFYLRPRIAWEHLSRIHSARSALRYLTAFFAFLKTAFR